MTPDGAEPHRDPLAPRRFDRFVLEPRERRLSADGRTLEVSGRYLDALILLSSEPGRLVSKDRFLSEVWKGVPVTDEALTQCIRALRKALGDDAARPRFIETAPKHGYRWVAEVGPVAVGPTPNASDTAAVVVAPRPTPERDWRRARVTAAAGMLGGGGAGLLGGMIYGLLTATDGEGGAASSVVVLAALTLWVGLVGGAGVGAGLGLATLKDARMTGRAVLGAALGGAVVGGLVRLIGSDAFALLLGRGPGSITGAGEGLALGLATGVGLWLGARGQPRTRLRRAASAAGVAGALAGLLASLMGGRLMAGSLEQLALRFPASRLRMDGLGAAFGEAGLGPVTRAVTAALEGGLFCACVAAAVVLALRSLARDEAE